MNNSQSTVHHLRKTSQAISQLIDVLEKEKAQKTPLLFLGIEVGLINRRQTERRDICGKIVKLNGDDQSTRLWCGDYRNCPYCSNVKAAELQSRISEILDLIPIYIIEIANDSTAKQLIRKLGKENYLRIPIPDGRYIVFNSDFGSPVTSLPELQNWAELLATIPEDRRISGHLGLEIGL